MGQVWYLIVSIPDLCNLITFLSIGGPCFVRMVGQVCPSEILLSNANHIDTEAVVLDLDQYIINDIVLSKVYNG